MADDHNSLPSLRDRFRPERNRLSRDLSISMAPSEIVTEGRKALDHIASEIGNQRGLKPDMRKTALWLIEIVKSNTALFDQGRQTKIDWREVPQDHSRALLANFAFFGAAAAMMLAAIIFKNGGALYGIGGLAALRCLDPKMMQAVRQKLPFTKTKPLAIEDLRARYQIEARIEADPKAFLSQIDQSLAAADHILGRLSLPQAQASWHDNPRLMGLMQNMLEAQQSGDQAYAMKLIDQELGALLGADGVEIIAYSPKTRDMFDILPSLGERETRMAAPALIKDGRVLRRGTVWLADHE